MLLKELLKEQCHGTVLSRQKLEADYFTLTPPQNCRGMRRKRPQKRKYKSQSLRKQAAEQVRSNGSDWMRSLSLNIHSQAIYTLPTATPFGKVPYAREAVACRWEGNHMCALVELWVPNAEGGHRTLKAHQLVELETAVVRSIYTYFKPRDATNDSCDGCDKVPIVKVLLPSLHWRLLRLLTLPFLREPTFVTSPLLIKSHKTMVDHNPGRRRAAMHRRFENVPAAGVHLLDPRFSPTAIFTNELPTTSDVLGFPFPPGEYSVFSWFSLGTQCVIQFTLVLTRCL